MVKITNGVVVYEVTRGAYDGIYARQGYTLVDDAKKEPAAAAQSEPHVVEEDKFAALLEKPISQWNKEEVRSFAADRGIDLSGTKNANEAKELIKAFLAEA